MKRIITLTLLLCNHFLFAYNHTGRISVSLMSGAEIRVMLDGYTYFPGSNRRQEITLHDIRSGYHELRIYAGHPGRGNRNSGKSRPLYSGTIFIRPGYHVDIILNRFGRVFFDEGRMVDDGSDSWEYGNPDNGGCHPMGRAAFQQLKSSLQQVAFESTRLNTARQAISGNYLEVSQVRELMDLFAFEDNKLEIARECYPLTTDKNEYYKLQEAFAFASNKESLLKIQERY